MRGARCLRGVRSARCSKGVRGARCAVATVAMLIFGAFDRLQAQEVEVIGLAVGESVRPVAIQDLDGGPVDLGKWVGRRPVLLEFWATWCSLCEALYPTLEAAHARHGDRVAFLAVAVGVNQNPASIRRHLDRRPMAFPILWDGRGAAVRAFRAPATSYVVVLDAAGQVVYTGIGAEQDVEQVLSALR